MQPNNTNIMYNMNVSWPLSKKRQNIIYESMWTLL